MIDTEGAETIFEQGVLRPGGYRDVSVSSIAERMPQARIIDVREPDEYSGDLGHLPGAELVPLGSVAQTARSWDPTQPLLVVCRSGNRSGSACQLLRQLGFLDVGNLAGGMLGVRALEGSHGFVAQEGAR